MIPTCSSVSKLTTSWKAHGVDIFIQLIKQRLEMLHSHPLWSQWIVLVLKVTYNFYSILPLVIQCARKHSSSSYYQRSCFHQCILSRQHSPVLLLKNSLWACTPRASAKVIYLLYLEGSSSICCSILCKWMHTVHKNSKLILLLSFYRPERLQLVGFHEHIKWWCKGFHVIVFLSGCYRSNGFL
jgi:hypothetical protein